MASADTEKKILNTAIRLFGEKGMDAVSTSEIAKEAGVNKALIFYHYDSKENLYKIAFKKLIQDMVETIHSRINELEPGIGVIEAFVRGHIGYLQKNEALVRFMVRELLSHDPGKSPILIECIDQMRLIRNDILKAINQARINGEMRSIDPLQTIVNILSLDVFFFLGKPMVALLQPNIDPEEFEAKRVDHVVDLLMNGLRKTPEQPR